MGQADRTFALLNRLTKNQESIERRLAPGRVAIVIGADAGSRPQGQLLSSFAVNLLARLYPVIQDLEVVVPRGVPLQIRPPRWAAESLDAHLRRFLQALDPPLKWSIREDSTCDRNWTLTVGAPPSLPPESVFIGGHGWEVRFSPNEPVSIGVEYNPVGAYAAACFGVAELCKRLLYPHRDLIHGVAVKPSEGAITFSTFTYRIGSSEPNPPLPPVIDLNRLTMVGLGAGGGATAFTLASLPELRGAFTLIDPDTIVDHNLNRNVFADVDDASESVLKVGAIEGLLNRFPSLIVKSIPTAFVQATAALGPEDYRYVVAAIHSREARRQVQYETPKVLWDAAAAEDGEFRIWRMILGQTECMFCKHPPGVHDPEVKKSEQVAQLLGLLPEVCLRKLRDNEVFTAEEVTAIVSRFGGNVQPFDLPAAGQRYGDWEASQCGRLPLSDDDEEIPIPFAPVMAGVLIAGEIIKEHHFPNAVLDSCYWNSLLGQFMPHNRAFRKSPRSGCSFCADQDYLAQYNRRWRGTAHTVKAR